MVEQEKCGKPAQKPRVQHQLFARQAEDAQRIAHTAQKRKRHGGRRIANRLRQHEHRRRRAQQHRPLGPDEGNEIGKIRFFQRAR